MNRINAVIVLVGIAVGVAVAQTPNDVFQRGNEFYRAGRFAEAAREYELILKQGYTSAPLYFNLGNAYYRLGELPQAILAYERAARLDPGDPDVQMNLKLANLRTVDRIEPVPELFLVTWLRELTAVLPLPAALSIGAAVWVILFLLLTILNFFPRLSWVNILRWGIMGSGVIVLLFAVLLTLEVTQAGDQHEAIVTSQVVTAKNSPDAQSVDAFVVHGGLKVRLSDEVGNWVKITLADGKVGWVQQTDVEQIVPEGSA